MNKRPTFPARAAELALAAAIVALLAATLLPALVGVRSP